MRNNAKTGADIAVELSRLRSKGQQSVSRRPSPSSTSTGPLVVGGSIFDFVVRLKEGEVSLKSPSSTFLGALERQHAQGDSRLKPWWGWPERRLGAL